MKLCGLFTQKVFNFLFDLFRHGAMFVHTRSKMRIIYQPVAYFVRVLGVVCFNTFNVDVTHADDNVCPGKQVFRNTLRAVVAAIVPDFLQSEQHFAWNLSM